MIWRPPRSTQSRSSAASDVYKRQEENLANFRMRFPKVDVIPLSALNGEGISRLKSKLDELVGYKFVR